MAADSGIRQGEVVPWGPRASVTLSGSGQEEWSYHDFVRVLLEIDSRSAWLKVRVIGAIEASELPRIFRTGSLRLIHAASCAFRYSSRTSCGVLYPRPEWRRVRL